MKSRLPILIAIVAAAVVAVAAVGVVFATRGDDAPQLHAVPYQTPLESPATRGRDSLGQPVSVPRDGRPAVVTFLFSHCPTVCPLVGSEIAAALDLLPAATQKDVDVVAISVDPRGDTRPAVTAFLEKHRLTGRMRYLVGTRAELEPLWRAWSIEAQPDDADATQSMHTARVVLIDRKGRQLGSYPGGVPIKAQDLADDIAALVAAK